MFGLLRLICEVYRLFQRTEFVVKCDQAGQCTDTGRVGEQPREICIQLNLNSCQCRVHVQSGHQIYLEICIQNNCFIIAGGYFVRAWEVRRVDYRGSETSNSLQGSFKDLIHKWIVSTDTIIEEDTARDADSRALQGILVQRLREVYDGKRLG